MTQTSKPDFDKIPDRIDVPENYIETKTEQHLKGGKPPYEVRKALGRTPTKPPKGWWPDEKKIEVASLYASGMTDYKDISKVSMVPAETVRSWRNSEWWPELIDRIHTEHDEDMDSKFTKIVDTALETVQDRIINGDYGYNNKTGEVYRKPMNGRDAAIVTAIIVDKRQLLRGKPTSRTERIGLDDRLTKIADQFRSFIQAKDITDETTVNRISDGNDIVDVEPNELVPNNS